MLMLHSQAHDQMFMLELSGDCVRWSFWYYPKHFTALNTLLWSNSILYFYRMG